MNRNVIQFCMVSVVFQFILGMIIPIATAGPAVLQDDIGQVYTNRFGGVGDFAGAVATFGNNSAIAQAATIEDEDIKREGSESPLSVVTDPVSQGWNVIGTIGKLIRLIVALITAPFALAAYVVQMGGHGAGEAIVALAILIWQAATMTTVVRLLTGSLRI